jgi:hypothetical protein
LAEDVNEQSYQGQPVLTWWQGQLASGYGLGDDLILNSSYQQADLSSIGGPRNGTVSDSIVQEIDVKTGRGLWEWHALGHVP